MRIETRYVCETCGTRYRSRPLAEACEAIALPPCPVAPGDAVRVRERYEEPQPDVVRSVTVCASALAFACAEMDGDHPTARRLIAGTGTARLHRWAITVGATHQLGKGDESLTDEVGLGDLMVDGRYLDEAA